MSQSQTQDTHNPILSLILCSRNDAYMGNSCWRLEIALNYAARKIHELKRETDVELVVADWGSEVPLSEVLNLSSEAQRITSFVIVPPAIAQSLQGNSSFPEVLALNAAARRARGEYLGRIDQDTLVGRKFLKFFFDAYEMREQFSVPMDRALLFSNRREIPYRFAVKCPPLANVEQLVELFGASLEVRILPERPFWTYWVGIWLVHRGLWEACGGYDERMIHYNWMETDMIARLMQRFEVVDLGKLVDYDFYHLEHYHPRSSLRGHPKTNASVKLKSPPTVFHPNDQNWGLNDTRLEIVRGRRGSQSRPSQWSLCFFLITLIQMVCDAIVVHTARSFSLTQRAASAGRRAISGKSFPSWPAALLEFWRDRKAVRLNSKS